MSLPQVVAPCLGRLPLPAPESALEGALLCVAQKGCNFGELQSGVGEVLLGKSTAGVFQQ